MRDRKTEEVRRMPLSGLFFAIGHHPATAFLEGQLELDEFGYIVTAPDSTATSIPGEPLGGKLAGCAVACRGVTCCQFWWADSRVGRARFIRAECAWCMLLCFCLLLLRRSQALQTQCSSPSRQ